MFPQHDLDFNNAGRLEREAQAAQHRLARSIRRTRSSRRWLLAKNRTRGSAPTSSHRCNLLTNQLGTNGTPP